MSASLALVVDTAAQMEGLNEKPDSKLDDLKALALRANEAHGRAQASGRAYLEAARAAGQALLDAKAQVAHGEWLDWLDKNVKFSVRSARTYMTIARYWHGFKRARPADLAEALRLVDRLRGKIVRETVDTRPAIVSYPDGAWPMPPGYAAREALASVRMLIDLERRATTARQVALAVADGQREALLEGVPLIASWLLDLRREIEALERAKQATS